MTNTNIIVRFISISVLGVLITACAGVGELVNFVNSATTPVKVSGVWITSSGQKVEISQQNEKLTYKGFKFGDEYGMADSILVNKVSRHAAYAKTIAGKPITQTYEGTVSEDSNSIVWRLNGVANPNRGTWYRLPTSHEGFDKNIARSGIRLKSVPDALTMGLCKKACLSNPECESFTFGFPGVRINKAERGCTLFSQDSRTPENAVGAYSAILPERASKLGKGGQYVIRFEKSGRALQNTGRDSVHMALATGAKAQQWEVTLVALDTYIIKHLQTGRYLAASKTGGVKLASNNASQAQRFVIDKARNISLQAKGGRLRMQATTDIFKVGLKLEVDGSRSPEFAQWEFVPSDLFGAFIEKDYEIELLNQSGYVASFFLYYENQSGQIVLKDSFEYVTNQAFMGFVLNNIPDGVKKVIRGVGDFLIPDSEKAVAPKVGSKSFHVPARARNVKVRVTRVGVDLSGPHNALVGTVGFNDPSKNEHCVSAWGVDPSGELIGKKAWADSNCTKWGSDTIKVMNDTDEVIYSMWTDEVKWSAANVAGGVITGLLINNTQNINANLYRYFAIANAWNIELPPESYVAFKAMSICLKPQDATPILTWNMYDMAQNMIDLGLLKSTGGKKTQSSARDKAGNFFLQWSADSLGQSDTYKQTYRQYNPVIAIADRAGAETKTIMAVNENLTKFWIIDSEIDANWIVRDNDIVRASDNDITKPLTGATEGNGERAKALTIDASDYVHHESIGKCFDEWPTILKQRVTW